MDAYRTLRISILKVVQLTISSSWLAFSLHLKIYSQNILNCLTSQNFIPLQISNPGKVERMSTLTCNLQCYQQ